jgi:hypothetical protein
MIYSLPTVERQKLLGLCYNALQVISVDLLMAKRQQLEQLHATFSANSHALALENVQTRGDTTRIHKKLDKARRITQLHGFQLGVVTELIQWRVSFDNVAVDAPVTHIIQE